MTDDFLDVEQALAAVQTAKPARRARIALTFSEARGAGIAFDGHRFAIAANEVARFAAAAEQQCHPRWVLWSKATADDLARTGIRLSTCWDLATVHRLLFGGSAADPVRIWSAMRGLDHRLGPSLGQLDLLGVVGEEGGDPEEPERPDGFLRPEWSADGWSTSGRRLARWATAAAEVAHWQHEQLEKIECAGDAAATARSESAAELLCSELQADGLPIDRVTAEELITSMIGRRPIDEADAVALREARDDCVLRHLPPASGIDLRSSADVKSMLRRIGVDVPDTRAWRLEQFKGVDPLIPALLQWRKEERVATTFGYGWLDANVGDDDRLRGEWSSSDGAAGRMTAGAGLHNLPAELRPIVVAEPGYMFVSADLGQIEPRVLAAISGDEALCAASLDDDLYAPVAKRLNVERSVAKVAVLAAMYGQTSGTAGQALRGMEAAYPVAVQFLADAARAGQDGKDLRTFGGRLIRMWSISDEADYRGAAAARGRYARNAMVQGSAAELFKVWAVTVRARGAGLGARIVLCLHDELLVHVPTPNAEATVELLRDCLAEAAYRWQRGTNVRFVTTATIVRSWADAK